MISMAQCKLVLGISDTIPVSLILRTILEVCSVCVRACVCVRVCVEVGQL